MRVVHRVNECVDTLRSNLDLDLFFLIEKQSWMEHLQSIGGMKM